MEISPFSVIFDFILLFQVLGSVLLRPQDRMLLPWWVRICLTLSKIQIPNSGLPQLPHRHIQKWYFASYLGVPWPRPVDTKPATSGLLKEQVFRREPHSRAGKANVFWFLSAPLADSLFAARHQGFSVGNKILKAMPAFSKRFFKHL